MGKTDTTYAFRINVLPYWNHWISMGLLSKNGPFRSIIFLNVFHNAVCLKSLNTYGITNKVLHLISMFSIMLYQWNHWKSNGMARKMMHIMYIHISIYTIYINHTSKYMKVTFCSHHIIHSKADPSSLSTPILFHTNNSYGS